MTHAAQRPVNTAKVRNPRWTGLAGEMAIIVSRGEPRRTNEQVFEAVMGQVADYLADFTDEDATAELVEATCELIAKDYIEPEGSQGVFQTRESLLLFVGRAREMS